MLALLAILFMILDHRQPTFLNLRSILSGLVIPLQYIADFPVQLIGAVAENFTTKRALLEENTMLKTQRLILTAELQKLARLEHENATLHNMLQPLTRQEAPVLVARVISVDSDAYTAQIIINKGKNKHVFVGQPVIDATGIVGQVIQVGNLTSRVLLITDSRSGIPVQVVRNGLRSILVGQGNISNLSLKYLSNTVDIKSGDQLVTSGLCGRFPAGYPVADVIKVSHPPDGSFLQVEVKPRANINGANLVLLIWPEKSKLDAELQQQMRNRKSQE